MKAEQDEPAQKLWRDKVKPALNGWMLNIMDEITAASHEQTSGIEQINQAIRQMDDVTQQNAALVEEAAAAAESLSDQAGNLSRVVGVFSLGESTEVATPATARVKTAASGRSIGSPPRAIGTSGVRPESIKRIATRAAAGAEMI